jgi:hypothetical protein
MALPVSFFSQTWADNTVKSNGEPETSNWGIAIATLTAANLVAKTALIGALETAVTGLVIGNLTKDETVVNRTVFTPGPASSPLAQRENKWLVRYHDASNSKKFRVSIPTADLTLLLPHSEFIDILTVASPGKVFADAFEGIAVSPDDDTHTTVVDSIQFVGRNS